MKSSERLGPCPACGAMTSIDTLAWHIQRMITLEKESRAQVEKKHVNYQITGLRQEAIIKSKIYEEKNRS